MQEILVLFTVFFISYFGIFFKNISGEKLLSFYKFLEFGKKFYCNERRIEFLSEFTLVKVGAGVIGEKMRMTVETIKKEYFN